MRGLLTIAAFSDRHGDVVALSGRTRRLCPGPAVASLFEARNLSGLLVGEDARPVDDRRLFGRGERHFDHVDAEESRVRILFRIGFGRTPRELLAGTHGTGAGAV